MALMIMIDASEISQTDRFPCPLRDKGDRVKTIVTIVLIVAAWYALNRFILPRLGIRG